jgi:hypothetical protein
MAARDSWVRRLPSWFEQMPSGRRGATECLLYAALLALALSRRLQKLVTDPESNPLSPNPPERWSHIF